MGQNTSNGKRTKKRLLRAAPLVAEPLPPEPQPAPQTPPAPIPVDEQPPAPVPVQAAAPVVAAASVPPAPIPVDPTPQPAVGNVPPAPIPVDPVVQPTPQPVSSQPQPKSPQPTVDQPQPETAPSQPAAKQSTTPQPQPAGATSPQASTTAAAATAGAVAAPIILTEEQRQAAGVQVREHGWKEGRKAVGVREEMEELAEEGAAGVFWRQFLAQHQSWAVSVLFHMVLIVILGLWLITQRETTVFLVASSEPIDEFELDEFEEMTIEAPEAEKDMVEMTDIVDRLEPEAFEPNVDNQHALEGIDSASQELVDQSLYHAPDTDILSEDGFGYGVTDQPGTGKGRKGTGSGLFGSGGGMGGRGGRRGNALKNGATPESESAVELALKWLAEHQLPDGSWSFNHTLAVNCQGKCPNPGEFAQARIGATALGVLPFLGAGYTNQVGKYKKTVAGGLSFLMANMKITQRGGELFEPNGRMYSHGLATIALCEAYAMQMNAADRRKLAIAEYDGSGQSSPGEKVRDREDPIPLPGLGQAAQAALNFVMYAQDPVGGGWRYEPRQPGDTSVVGWQLMALISGKLAYLRVHPQTFLMSTKFLDHVQMDDYGSDYGYTGKDRSTIATQAIGLLCRMYLGWGPDHVGISQGVDTMVAHGPSSNNMYYNYYATQVLHHTGGDRWEKQWNPRMRDSLVGSQSHNGCSTGSWFFTGDHGSTKGGRLYCTALAAMTLEVYYRHMPLYHKDVLEKSNVGAELEKLKAQEAQIDPEADF